MEQVLAPCFNFKTKTSKSGPEKGFDYGEGGYDPKKENVGFNNKTGQFHIEINGLSQPKSKEAKNICMNDLNELIAVFMQDKNTIARGFFDEGLIPEELTQVHMGKIVKEKYPDSWELELAKENGLSEEVSLEPSVNLPIENVEEM